MQLFKIVGSIIVLFILLSFPLKYFLRTEFTPWTSKRKLKWKDFKGKAPKDYWGSARTGCFYNYDEKLVDDSIEIEMDNSFMVYSSFVVHGRESEYVLNHEQRHFDIGEIYVRRLREYISQWNGYAKDNYNSYLLDGWNKIFSDSIAFDYERETNHGMNRAGQNYWNNKIDSILKKYDHIKRNIFKLHWPAWPEGSI
jgi:hypothetical protein